MASGDQTAVAELYDRYHRVVFSFILRMVSDRPQAEELVQEVFIRAWRQAHRFTDAKGTFLSWLLSITHNIAIDHLRKQTRRPMKADASDPLELMASVQDEGPPVDEVAILRQLREVVTSALADLPIEQRTALELAYYRGHTQREIAEIQNEPLGTIKTRMRLALKKLRISLEDQGLDVS